MKDLAFVKLGICRTAIWIAGLWLLNNYIHDLFDTHDVFCYTRSLTTFVCPYFVIYRSLGVIKVNPRLMSSDAICERSSVVFRELCHQLFGNSYPSKFLLFCKDMGYPSGTFPSHFHLIFNSSLRIVWTNTIEIPTHLAIIPVGNLACLYTKNTAVLDIEPFFVKWKETFS
jgi:hypothetical protein